MAKIGDKSLVDSGDGDLKETIKKPTKGKVNGKKIGCEDEDSSMEHDGKEDEQSENAEIKVGKEAMKEKLKGDDENLNEGDLSSKEAPVVNARKGKKRAASVETEDSDDSSTEGLPPKRKKAAQGKSPVKPLKSPAPKKTNGEAEEPSDTDKAAFSSKNSPKSRTPVKNPVKSKQAKLPMDDSSEEENTVNSKGKTNSVVKRVAARTNSGKIKYAEEDSEKSDKEEESRSDKGSSEDSDFAPKKGTKMGSAKKKVVKKNSGKGGAKKNNSQSSDEDSSKAGQESENSDDESENVKGAKKGASKSKSVKKNSDKGGKVSGKKNEPTSGKKKEAVKKNAGKTKVASNKKGTKADSNSFDEDTEKNEKDSEDSDDDFVKIKPAPKNSRKKNTSKSKLAGNKKGAKADTESSDEDTVKNEKDSEDSDDDLVKIKPVPKNSGKKKEAVKKNAGKAKVAGNKKGAKVDSESSDEDAKKNGKDSEDSDDDLVKIKPAPKNSRKKNAVKKGKVAQSSDDDIEKVEEDSDGSDSNVSKGKTTAQTSAKKKVAKKDSNKGKVVEEEKSESSEGDSGKRAEAKSAKKRTRSDSSSSEDVQDSSKVAGPQSASKASADKKNRSEDSESELPGSGQGKSKKSPKLTEQNIVDRLDDVTDSDSASESESEASDVDTSKKEETGAKKIVAKSAINGGNKRKGEASASDDSGDSDASSDGQGKAKATKKISSNSGDDKAKQTEIKSGSDDSDDSDGQSKKEGSKSKKSAKKTSGKEQDENKWMEDSKIIRLQKYLRDAGMYLQSSIFVLLYCYSFLYTKLGRK